MDGQTDRPTDRPTDWMMPSDKHNLEMAASTGLISLLFDDTYATTLFVIPSLCPSSLSIIAKGKICCSTMSGLHGRLSNYSDCRSVSLAILLLETFFKMVNASENEAYCPIYLFTVTQWSKGARCHQWIFHIFIVARRGAFHAFLCL